MPAMSPDVMSYIIYGLMVAVAIIVGYPSFRKRMGVLETMEAQKRATLAGLEQERNAITQQVMDSMKVLYAEQALTIGDNKKRLDEQLSSINELLVEVASLKALMHDKDAEIAELKDRVAVLENELAVRGIPIPPKKATVTPIRPSRKKNGK